VEVLRCIPTNYSRINCYSPLGLEQLDAASRADLSGFTMWGRVNMKIGRKCCAPFKARSFQLLATTLLPEYLNPGSSSTISIIPIPRFSAQIDAPESAQFGQWGIS